MEKDIKKVIEEIEVPMKKLDDAIKKGIKNSHVKTKNHRYSTIMLGGVAITIEEIVYDGTRMAFTYTHDIEGYAEIYPLTIKINGEEINFSESLHELEAETGFRGLIEVIPVETLPDSFQLDISIHQIGDTKGEWAFSTELTKVKNNSRELKAGQEGTIDGIDFTIQKAEVSDTGTIIEVAFDHSKMGELFTAERLIQGNFTDQNGMPLQIVQFSGSDNIYKYILEPLSDEVTEIHVLVYSMSTTFERVEISEKLTEQFPQTISQGEMGDIVITDVQNVDNEYVMTFHSTSDFSFDAGFTPNVIDVLDENGNYLITDYPKAIGPNEYELKFSATSSKVFVHTIELPKMEIEQSAKVVIPLN